MKFIVACGGTGGHSFPGIAVAEELLKRGHEVHLWASGRDIESQVMKTWKGQIFSTGARQLSIRHLFANAMSFFHCCKEMKRISPDAILAMGSYSSLPPVMAARRYKVRVYLHEANTIPGKAVEFLSHFANAVAISFDVTARYLPWVKTIRTGLPVRSSITQGNRFPFIPQDSFVIFVTGGSQGAHALNELCSKAIVMMKSILDQRGDGRKLYVIHQTGIKDEADVIGAYTRASLPSRVYAFENEMANAFASADIVIARAGASTCFELAACGKPALLIPLPSAMKNHQHFNADAFAAKGAADEGIQAKLSARQICRYLLERYNNPERLLAMSSKIKALSTLDAAESVADLVEGKILTTENKK